MPMRLQAKLLRVLQTGEMQRVGSSRVRYVNVRVLSATNADLDAESPRGRFREDVLYRLNTVVVQLPPLRDRRDDVEPLAQHYLAHYARRYAKPHRRVRRRARCAALARTAGRATCASWRTASSAPC